MPVPCCVDKQNMQQDPVRDILPALGANSAGAAFLLKHARNDNLLVENGTVHFVDRTARNAHPVAFSGITRPLHALYWPAFVPFGRSTQKRPRPASSKKSAKKQVAGFQSAQTLAKSHVRGTIVHRQMGEYMRFDKRHFDMRNPSKLHPLGEVGLLAMLQNNYLPIAFDFPVANEAIRVGTPIDAICVHEKTGRVMFVETKTAASRELFVQDDPNAAWHGALTDCTEARSACTRAKVQLGLSVMLLIMGHGFPYEWDARVLLLVDDPVPTAEYFDLDEAFLLNVIAPVYNDFVAQVPRWRQQNKAMKKRAAHAQ